MGNIVTTWKIGIRNKITQRFGIPMDVRNPAKLVLKEQLVWLVNIQISSTVTPLEFVFTRQMFVTDILIQAVVGMMKVLITATKNTIRGELLRDMLL